MELDETQRASQEQFGRQSDRYGARHILADVTDVAAAIEKCGLPGSADVLDVACGAGHTGLHLAGMGHRVTLADIALPMLEEARRLFRIGEEDRKIVWWWRRLTLIARKTGQ